MSYLSVCLGCARLVFGQVALTEKLSSDWLIILFIAVSARLFPKLLTSQSVNFPPQKTHIEVHIYSEIM